MNRIKIVYDNQVSSTIQGLKAGWGFAAYVEWDGKKILFDTGWDGDRLMNNWKILGLPLTRLDAIILSHTHWDHIGGLAVVLNLIGSKEIYLPADFSKNLTREIEQFGISITIVKSSMALENLSVNIISTGTYIAKGDIKEQALILKDVGEQTGILIVGCSHPGLNTFITAAEEFCHVRTVIGGVHDFNDPRFIESKIPLEMYFGHCSQHLDKFQMIDGAPLKKVMVGLEIK